MSYRYTEDHEWVLLEDDVATIGISDYAQGQLGDVVYVEVPEVGSDISKGDELAVVESVKAASEVYSPVSGEVIEVNEDLDGSPTLVNEAPLEGGWFAKVKVTDSTEIDDLMDEETYKSYVEGLDE
ncbi:MAG: glycine cleavage system protein H [Sneathiella sp.]|uniref:glycine cleavage system protein GcvH n=1 Tax=Sneathiella sp. TaxID=1964365 RepID=UPI000C666DEC|nr:glycine cleavage system protein GcvH [Sneathiella sp.]MAZ02945.1 glycine cleavage system protein H [Sneathiella sp.]|tara:strand:+ start:469 stop:846 length:378 start_codon:yes stop_codon:yes gene_type:complete